MRRMSCLTVAAGLLLASVGCIAVVGNKGRFEPTSRQLVERDGKLYVVDVYTGEVMTLDEDHFTCAKPIKPCDDE